MTTSRTRDGRRQRRREWTIRRLCIQVVALWLAIAPVAAQAVVEIYHSPTDDGARGSNTVPPGTHVLHLWVDGGPLRSNFDECGPLGNGDEVCAYLFDLETRFDAELLSFVGQSDVYWRYDAGFASITGGQPVAPLPGPYKIGDLTISGDEGGTVELVWGQAVRANQQLVQLASDTIVEVPEPGLGVGLALGALGLLRAHRRRRAPSRGSLRPPMRRRGLGALDSGPDAA